MVTYLSTYFFCIIYKKHFKIKLIFIILVFNFVKIIAHWLPLDICPYGVCYRIDQYFETVLVYSLLYEYKVLTL